MFLRRRVEGFENLFQPLDVARVGEGSRSSRRNERHEFGVYDCPDRFAVRSEKIRFFSGSLIGNEEVDTFRVADSYRMDFHVFFGHQLGDGLRIDADVRLAVGHENHVLIPSGPGETFRSEKESFADVRS